MQDLDGICTCQPEECAPSNLVRGLCEQCGLEISWEQMDRYNRHFGFSGYDEFNDDEEVYCATLHVNEA